MTRKYTGLKIDQKRIIHVHTSDTTPVFSFSFLSSVFSLFYPFFFFSSFTFRNYCNWEDQELCLFHIDCRSKPVCINESMISRIFHKGCTDLRFKSERKNFFTWADFGYLPCVKESWLLKKLWWLQWRSIWIFVIE